MKKTLLFSVLAAVTLCITSCNKNEYMETYQAKYRINKIWVGTESDTIANFTFNYDSKNVLIGISTKDSANYIFEYNVDKEKIISITHDNKDYNYKFKEKISLNYDSEGYLAKMEYLIDGSIRKTCTFHRKQNKAVASIIEMYDFEFYNAIDIILKSDFYNFFMGEEKYMIELLQKRAKSTDFQLESITIPVYEKDPENDKDPVLNIVKTYKTIPDQKITYITTYTYNNTLNPFFGLPFSYKGMASLSKNNKASEYIEYTNEIEFDTVMLINKSYEYRFDQHNNSYYPDKIIEKSTDHFGGFNTYILYHPKDKK